MEWSYRGPSKSAKDAVRFLIGDTDECERLLYDEEIEYLLEEYNNTPLNASIRACEVLMAKFARLANEQVGSVRIDYSQKIDGYKKLKAELQQRLAVTGALAFAGGISECQKARTESDPDRVEPSFTKHMMENEEPWVTDNGKPGNNQE